LSLGFAAAGFRMAAALDVDPSAVKTMKANRGVTPAIVVKRDIRKFGPRAMERRLRDFSRKIQVGLVVAGPPCQGWSQVGRGKLRSLGRFADAQGPFDDPRNRLYRSFLRYLDHFKPVACVMENVPGMASYQGQNVSEIVKEAIASLGYRVVLFSLEAQRLGVPQVRNRLLFVGVREDQGAALTVPSVAPEDLNLPSRWQSVRDAIRDLPWIPAGRKIEPIRYPHTRSASRYIRLLRPGWMNGSIDGHITRWHGSQDIAAFGLMPEGGIYRDLPARLRRYRVDIFPDKYRRLSWDMPSPCLTAHLSRDCYSHIHPSQSRTISVREAARLQSFPDWYRLEGSMGNRFRLIGNAVPPLVAYSIAKAIADSLSIKCDMNWASLQREAGRSSRGS
jgi:DNA (cytosine-5)-methyltransferase 1